MICEIMILATSVALWVKAWLRTPSGIGRPHCDIIVASVYVRGEQGVWNGDDVGREDDRSPRWETNGSTVHVVLNRGSLNFASLEYSALNPVLVFFIFFANFDCVSEVEIDYFQQAHGVKEVNILRSFCASSY